MIASDYRNVRNGFPSTPVYGILCDGQSFQFFSFDGSTKPPIISQGVFGPGEHQTLSLAHLTSTGPTDFIMSLRPICEVIFFFLFLGYTTGLEACYERSVEMGFAEKQTQESTTGLMSSYDLGIKVSRLAVEGTSQAAGGDIANAEATADAALAMLMNRLPLSLSRWRCQTNNRLK
jgi:hypothetical protein